MMSAQGRQDVHRHSPPGPQRPGAPTIQRSAVARSFEGRQHIVRPPQRADARAEELVLQPGGRFAVRSEQHRTLQPPTGTFNFVRVQGDVPRARPTLISSRLPHAQIAGGRSVVYAGTVHFDGGEMAWWSNYSGTYQPIAAFRAQAGLPDEKFVPWQKLALGGVAMQRGAFRESRPAERPPAVERTARGTDGAKPATPPGKAPAAADPRRPTAEKNG